MYDPAYIDRRALERTAMALEEINNEVVYVGGAVTGLYVNDPAAEPPRPTRDIDITIQVSSYAQMDRLREKLAEKRIFPASGEKVLFRYVFEDILIDFIPWEETPLGPANRWLKKGFEWAYPVSVGKKEIKILPAPYFLASKWEAFRHRGDDPRTSPDLEDILYVIDHRPGLPDDINLSEEDVKNFLAEMGRELLSHEYRDEIIECHLDPFHSADRKKYVLDVLQKISDLT